MSTATHLTSGKLYWPTIDAAPSSFPALERDLDCDIVVIGGGITGALVAGRLVEAGLDVVLVDRKKIGSGSTAASTALLLYEIDVPLIELKKKVGNDHAIRSYRRCRRAIDDLRDIIAGLDGCCDFVPRKSLYLASSADDVPDLKEECEARRAIGIDVDFLDASAIRADYTLDSPGALISDGAAQVDPYRLAHLLIQRSVQKGLRVFESTEVAKWDAEAGGVSLYCESGRRIRARRVVIATGYEADRWFHQPLTKTQTTYVLVSEPVESFTGWKDRCLIWETARPYLYMRTTSDGRVMIGGEDDDSTKPASPAKLGEKAATLLRKFKNMFPEISFAPAMVYSGLFESTSDGLPFIGRHPEFPNVHFALGYGGNGITFSVIAAQLLRDEFLGKKSEDADLFVFGRTK